MPQALIRPGEKGASRPGGARRGIPREDLRHVDRVEIQQEVLEFVFCRRFDRLEPDDHGLVVKHETVFDSFRIIVIVNEPRHELHGRFFCFGFVFRRDQVMMAANVFIFSLADFNPVIWHAALL
jgi:hypothetical protein